MGLLKKLFRYRDIYGEGDLENVYLRRYYIFRPKWFPWFGVLLHEIMRSDEDRHLHCHPWRFTSVLLKGKYTEVTPERKRECSRFTVIRHKAEDQHRLILNHGTVWTLVFVGKSYREWGFHTEDGFIEHFKYDDYKRGHS